MIKTIKFKRFFKSTVFIFSVLILSACLSTKQAEPSIPSQQENQVENTVNATENLDIQKETLPLYEETELSNTQASFEETSEKIDRDEILTNPSTEEEIDFFSEPDVFEAEPEEKISETDSNQIPESEEQGLSQNVDAETQKEEIISKTQSLDTTSVETENSLKENTKKQAPNSTIEQSVDNFSKDSELTTEENAPPSKEIAEDNFQQKNGAIISPSRSMSVKNNQYVDVVYPGSGWIYIGEVGNENLFRYFGRKLGNKDTTFTLRSSKSGKTILHFYKNDILTSQYIDDYLEVVVEEDSAKLGEKATAPAYALVVPPKPVRNEVHFSTEKPANEVAKTKNEEKSPSVQQKKEDSPATALATQTSKTQDDNLKTIIQTTQDKEKTASAQSNNSFQNSESQNVKTDEQILPLTPTLSSSGSLLEQAKKSYSAKNYENALVQIQEYLDSANTKIDEALFVQAQILEADSKVRNIKSALDSYETIIKKYPTSKFWQNANKRKIYLERYYINIY